jgi:hypothetical protein
MDRLIEALSKALGLGGRGRRLGDAAEKARTAVTWRIRHAVRKVEAAHPELGRHLANSLKTGTFCVYQPERVVRWQLDATERDQSRRVALTSVGEPLEHSASFDDVTSEVEIAATRTSRWLGRG